MLISKKDTNLNGKVRVLNPFFYLMKILLANAKPNGIDWTSFIFLSSFLHDSFIFLLYGNVIES